MSSEGYIPLLKRLLADGKVWTTVGVVKAPEGEEHYEITDDDVYVDVKLCSGDQVLCRLGAMGAGGAGLGLWCIPAVGTEVAVLVPRGELEADPVIVAILASGQVPDGLDGSGTTVLVVKAGATVLVHDGDAGDAVRLAKHAHTHPLPKMQVTVTDTGSGNPETCTVSVATPTPSPGDVGEPPNGDGTDVLKAK